MQASRWISGAGSCTYQTFACLQYTSALTNTVLGNVKQVLPIAPIVH